MKQFEVHTDHLPTKEEELNWKKEQLRQVFGTELFDELYSQAISFLTDNKKHIIKQINKHYERPQ